MINGQGLTGFYHTSLCLNYIFLRYNKNADENCKLAVETLQESVKVCQSLFTFYVPLFPTLINEAKHSVLLSCFQTLSKPLLQQNKVSISVNPWVFCYPSMLIVLIAAYSWDNISWEFLGCWKVILARIRESVDSLCRDGTDMHHMQLSIWAIIHGSDQ